MRLKDFNTVYFIGIGGIGMSALARYFNAFGKKVMGYDRAASPLTKKLEEEGALIHYEDWRGEVLNRINKEDTLVIYTPAVSDSLSELKALKEQGFLVVKRAQALGLISSDFKTYAVAGTHGKTTTTAILANVLEGSSEGCNAFIGGISTNFNSNCVINKESSIVVLEADEFDRSFLTLKPHSSIITSVDADHLDIYKDTNGLLDSFNEFISLNDSEGFIVAENSAANSLETDNAITYGSDAGEYQLKNYRFEDGCIVFDIWTSEKKYTNIEFGIPGRHNAENATGVFTLCINNGISEENIRKGLKSFKGVKRRFEYKIRNENIVMIDDYAHHPTEIRAFICAVHELYPNKRITAAFQPHLFSRTKDFMNEFADALSQADDVLLLPIYPARELPIEGVTSENLLKKITSTHKSMSNKENIAKDLSALKPELVVVLGAGDIDGCVEPIKRALLK